MIKEFDIIIGGEAGQGLITISEVLLKILSRSGYGVFACQDYMSRVRGGHNFMQIHINNEQVFSVPEWSNMLLALDQKSMEEHASKLTSPAILVFDNKKVVPPPGDGYSKIGIPLADIAAGFGNPVFSNIAALGALMGILGLDIETLNGVIKERFSGKDEKIIQANISASRAGLSFYVDNYPGAAPLLEKARNTKSLMLINGAHAAALGFMAGGVRFIAAYPMSPSTSIFTYITGKAGAMNIVSEQAEDEIAAANMAIGASAAGARSLVTTSGGGLDLMAEAISLAGISEVPLVIANIQRPGPATGLPTRTAQEDLDLVINIGHGEFPRFVFAPGTAEDSFYTAIHAMNLADKFQVPAFFMGDQFLSDSFVTMEKLDADKVKYENFLMDGDAVEKPYQRYQFTAGGVSPRLPYGIPGAHFITDSHVHLENGHITEDMKIAAAMAEKRFLKLAEMTKEPHGLPAFYGPKNAEVVFLSWGSTYGPLRDTVDYLNSRKRKAAMLHFNRVWPFPAEEAAKALHRRKKIHVVEGNFQSQFSRLLKRETGIVAGAPVLRYDGRPFNREFIIRKIREIYPWKI